VRITVTLDPIFDLGTIIGKVFYDENRDGWQDKGEEGVAGVMVALDSGIYALTDEHGRYHFPAVKPGHRLVKVNLRSLADGAQATTRETVVVNITPGIMAKANFGVIYEPDTEKTGKPAEPGLILESKAAQQPIQILGNAENMKILINGEMASMPNNNVRLMVENLERRPARCAGAVQPGLGIVKRHQELEAQDHERQRRPGAHHTRQRQAAEGGALERAHQRQQHDQGRGYLSVPAGSRAQGRQPQHQRQKAVWDQPEYGHIDQPGRGRFYYRLQ
jgi:hypothetical protein